MVGSALPTDQESKRAMQMILAISPAFTKTFGLLVTFIGIGVIVNLIVVFIAAQIHGEREQNRRDRQTGSF
jgi:hypothetical protein